MKNIISILLLSIISLSAKARIYGEPIIGFSNFNGESTFSTTTFEHEYSAPMIGARVGYSFSPFILGFQYSQSSGIMDTTENNGFSSDEIKSTKMSLFFGIMFSSSKLWLNYYLSSKVEGVDDQASSGNQFISSSNEIDSGNGFGGGYGFYLTDSIQLNLEYKTITYDNYKTNGAISSSFSESKLSEYTLTLSIPFGDSRAVSSSVP